MPVSSDGLLACLTLLRWQETSLWTTYLLQRPPPPCWERFEKCVVNVTLAVTMGLVYAAELLYTGDGIQWRAAEQHYAQEWLREYLNNKQRAIAQLKEDEDEEPDRSQRDRSYQLRERMLREVTMTAMTAMMTVLLCEVAALLLGKMRSDVHSEVVEEYLCEVCTHAL